MAARMTIVGLASDPAELDAVSLVEFGLHCVRRPSRDASLVFVHGILSDGADAWGHPAWPDLVKAEADFADLGIFVLRIGRA